ncbi:40S ribosomal protein S5-1 [Hordeum vulgare]|nr:40S ribosomal protein S5-1 [Hordeum vulgare]
MSEGMLHIRDVEGPKKTGSMETRLEAMEQQVFKCQGMVERGLNANHMMITEFTNNHKMDAIDIGKHLSRLYDRVDQLQGQIYDLQNQNYTHLGKETRFRKLLTGKRIPSAMEMLARAGNRVTGLVGARAARGAWERADPAAPSRIWSETGHGEAQRRAQRRPMNLQRRRRR